MVSISMHFWTYHHYPIYTELAQNLKRWVKPNVRVAISTQMRTNYPHFNVEML